MENERIDETDFSVDDLEIGGERKQQLKPDMLSVPVQYVVTDLKAVKTQWGDRIDFTVRDAYAEYVVSSWNLSSLKKFKPKAILNRKVKLTPKGKYFNIEVMD